MTLCYWLELRCWQGRAPSTYFKMLVPQWPPPVRIYLQELQNKCQMLSNKRKKLSVWISKVSGSTKTQNSTAKMWTKSSMNNFPNDFLSSRSFWIFQRTWPYLLKTVVLLSSGKKAEVKDKGPSKMRCYLRTPSWSEFKAKRLQRSTRAHQAIQNHTSILQR